MAKKKKATKKKRSPKVEVIREPNPIWGYVFAVVFMLIGVFMLLGGFGTGGSLPKGLFHAGYWLLGWGAWIIPASLLYWGFYKFAYKDEKAPMWRIISMYVLMVLMSALFFTVFASKQLGGEITGGKGGAVGSFVGGVALSALDKIPASLLFFISALFAFFFAFGISPKILLRLGDMFKRPEVAEDEDIASLKERAKDTSFKIVRPHEVKEEQQQAPIRSRSMRNSAKPLTKTENHEALTTASDPDWKLPSVDLLDKRVDEPDAGDPEANAHIIKNTLANFGIDVVMNGAKVGPRVTQYTLTPPSNVKLTKITALENNLALNLAATNIRIEAPIPGQRYVGIEVPNLNPATVRLSAIFQSKVWKDAKSPLTFAVGEDIAGESIIADLAKMPHLLVAGQTGSGKSVMINDILSSLIYRNSPNELKLILVDPKQVELTPYDGIPHLLTGVIHEPERTISALKWGVAEMERRLRTMAEVKKRNIQEFNALKKSEGEAGMPYIVIVIDELADLMMVAARDVETLIARIAQKARAVGIHLVLATQRPSVDVITGLIKANVPGRIAFTTQSQVDSRTIIDQAGANKLLGRGDMLLKTSEMPAPKRIQAAFITDEETIKINEFIKEQREPDYNDEIISQPVQLNGKGGVVSDDGGARGGSDDEEMFRDAVRVVIDNNKASTSLLQRRLRIGYGRAARLIEEMEDQGIIGQADGSRPREVLVSSLDQVFDTSSQDELMDDDFGARIPDPMDSQRP